MNFFTSGFQVSRKVFFSYLLKPYSIIYGTHICTRIHICKSYSFRRLLFPRRKRKKIKSWFLDYICLSLDLINLCNIILLLNKSFELFLTFSRVCEKYICYLLALCYGRRKSEVLLLFTCFLLKGTKSYPV